MILLLTALLFVRTLANLERDRLLGFNADSLMLAQFRHRAGLARGPRALAARANESQSDACSHLARLFTSAAIVTVTAVRRIRRQRTQSW
jgi:hypothetical protein